MSEKIELTEENLAELRESIRKTMALLDDPHLGLSTWVEILRFQLGQIVSKGTKIFGPPEGMNP